MFRNRNIILPEAAKWRGRTIALYGGSFNPAHEGHRHVAQECLKRLNVDAIWFLVSPGNPQKQTTDMASFNQRVDSLKAIIGNHPRMQVTDIEKRLESRYSADTIAALKKAMPHTKFIWIIGADNLATFHTWKNWRDIVRSLPIAVFDRPGYSMSGLTAPFVEMFGRFRTSPQKLGKSNVPAWAFLTIPRHPASATQLRRLLGKKWLASKKRRET